MNSSSNAHIPCGTGRGHYLNELDFLISFILFLFGFLFFLLIPSWDLL